MTEEELAERLREIAAEEMPDALVEGTTTDDPPGFEMTFTSSFGEQRFRIRVVQL